MSNGSEHIPEGSALAGETIEADPGVESNPGEFAAIWNRRTEEQRAEMLRNMRSAVLRSNRCLMNDHDVLERRLNESIPLVSAQALIEERDALRARLEQIRARLHAPIRPYGDKTFPMVAEHVFLADAYGEDLPRDLLALVEAPTPEVSDRG